MAVAFSPDGTLLASGSRDTTICLWKTQTGTLMQRLAVHGADIYAVVFSPDGKTIATGSGGQDATIKLWRLADLLPDL